jgi:hypothetical protein
MIAVGNRETNNKSHWLLICLITVPCQHTNSADSSSSSSATADNTNNINNSACAVAVSTCPKGSTPTSTPTLTLPNSGVLEIIKVCFPSCQGVTFSIKITGNNPQPSSFTLSIPSHKSQDVTLGPGTFTVTEAHVAGFHPPSFANDCRQIAPGSFSATGTIRAGQPYIVLSQTSQAANLRNTSQIDIIR